VATRTYVALDLETTGTDVSADLITEIGAVRFTDEGVLDRFSTLVKPRHPIPPRIQELTHISNEMVADAPDFWAVAPQLQDFIGTDPIVGQNISYDLTFLRTGGVESIAPAYDTHELATILLTGLRRYGLKALADEFDVDFPEQHRALADAEASMHVFLRLKQAAREIDRVTLAQIARMGRRAGWVLASFFEDIAAEHGEDAELSLGRVGVEVTRVSPLEPLRPAEVTTPVPPQNATAALRAGAASFAAFEQRDQQLRMAYAVAKAFAEGGHLLVEAGTGTGKSLAYLVPAALHALENSERVVISTNTINLQEQLLNKDVPLLRELLEQRGVKADADTLRVTQLKGRRNYLCLRRWQNHLHSNISGEDDARITAKLLLWLPRTETGDRSELNLSGREEQIWWRLSAQDANCMDSNCPFVRDGSCFLMRARRGAEASHLLIVNHSLLLADIASGGSAIPSYRHLVIDEAHNLEDEATQQFGFSAGPNDLDAFLNTIHERQGRQVESGLLSDAAVAVGPLLDGPLGAVWKQRLGAVERAVDAARLRVPQFFDAAAAFFKENTEEGGEYDHRLLLTRAGRHQHSWSNVELAWENLAGSLREVDSTLEELQRALLDEKDLLLDRDALAGDVVSARLRAQDLGDRLGRIVTEHSDDTVVWLTWLRATSTVLVASAPLEVGDLLAANLFERQRTAILTSATMSAAGEFDYISRRLGLEGPKELLLDSPFPFEQNALLCVTDDMPEPQSPQYQQAMQQAIIDLVTASQGRALILFTSHAQLRNTYHGVKNRLWERGILALAQGIDASAAKLVLELKGANEDREKPRAIFGTASLWEGIDVEGEALSLVAITKLPFPVPTDPVFAARSELMERPFDDYAVPQAVLKFRQGFGRLIRSSSDRGVVVVLDRRVKTKTYGRMFLQSLPKTARFDGPVRSVAARTGDWLRPASRR
jgi:DNA polymerase-3 subunit epsilon/ATP-dependent DNA helicase DinG